MNESVIGIIC